MEIEKKHLTIQMSDMMLQDTPPNVQDAAYLAWKEGINLTYDDVKFSSTRLI
jgi:hypothetical protein